MNAAKTAVAVIGAAVTSALAIFPQGTATWNALTIASAALTALAVYLVPNTPTA
jgi:hypothetical protein